MKATTVQQPIPAPLATAVTLTQEAPWPAELADLVEACTYRSHEGWTVRLDADQDRDEVDGQVVGHGATLVITTRGFDAYHPDHGPTYGVHHYFIVPAATYNRAAWMRWLFDQYAKVELHECMENFTVRDDSLTELEDECTCGHAATRHDGRSSTCADCDLEHHRFEPKTPRLARPFAPLHGPGCDPYTVHQFATDEQRRTRFTGEVLPS